MPSPEASTVRWVQPDGQPVSCLEKLKVLNQNLDEIRQSCQDALEDAVLMGCDEAQLREILHRTVDQLVNPYTTARNAGAKGRQGG